ncbi:MAG: transposase, partial [Anaerolineae bacterium]|nr:transposase [Anaerolineae bacterium]
MNAILDLYSDYLISSYGQVTATKLSELVGGQISHDKITRELGGPKLSGRELWQVVKPLVRKMEDEDGVLILDDSIAEKPSSDENELICWHWDHSEGRAVKGINFITALYHSKGVSLPVGYELVMKTDRYFDKKSQQFKRRSTVSK